MKISKGRIERAHHVWFAEIGQPISAGAAGLFEVFN
jgi:hypothetical protein